MSATHLCPRREEGFGMFNLPESDVWRENGTCSFCGSMNPDAFMQRCESGDVELEPTDKNYKVYVSGAGLKTASRDCPKDAKCTGPDDCTHWVTREASQGKFYFQHLSVEQRRRFVELINEKSLKMGYPGRFYVLPFFCTRHVPASPPPA